MSLAKFTAIAEAAGIEVNDYTPGHRYQDKIQPYVFTLDAPQGKVFRGTGIHCDCGVQGDDGVLKTNWKQAIGYLRELIAQGFDECDEIDCEFCNPSYEE